MLENDLRLTKVGFDEDLAERVEQRIQLFGDGLHEFIVLVAVDQQQGVEQLRAGVDDRQRLSFVRERR